MALFLTSATAAFGLATSAGSSASSGAVNLDFDLSFLAQMAAFAVFVGLMKPLLFDPMMKLFEEREKRTDGARAAARSADDQAADIVQTYEAALEKVRRAASEEREKLRAEGAKLEAEILEEARAEVAGIVESGKARIAAEASTVRAELFARADEIARDVASRVAGREVA